MDWALRWILRDCTDDPSVFYGGLHPRFCPPQLDRRPPLRRVPVEHSELSTHRCFGVVDGLLVLCDDDEATNHAVRLLNPLAGALARFPAITDVRDTRPTTAAVLNAFSWGPLTREEMRAVIMSTPKVEVPGDPSAINGAAIDDSTSPPTLHWVAVHFGEQQEPLHNGTTVMSQHGTAIVALGSETSAYSYLDVVGGRLIPLNGIGKYAVFIGRTYSIMLPSDKFTKLAPVYPNFFHQKWRHLGIYQFKDRRINPPREFTQDAHMSLSPCACHWELADI
ncbi:hypothetical protein HU200_045104 [Digitaria exilis]|uniref:Uncharacterized protein n=1 Tax=Digitaria exilis TaxID=1010633 RepID=A0A835B2Q5_9POAL|nr:hypothetical protein HU200_045104 [Digitaria exilis]